jgi:hypothetical protein
MLRPTWVVLLGVLLAIPGGARAEEKGPAGTWKVILMLRNRGGGFSEEIVWLFQLTSKDKKWAGKITTTQEGYPKPTDLGKVKVSATDLSFTFKLRADRYEFLGKFAKDQKTVLGTLGQPGGGGVQVLLARLERTTIKDLDPFTLAKETLARDQDSYKVFDATLLLLRLAGDKKAKPAEIKAWAARAYQKAEAFGPRWQRAYSQQLAEVLSRQDGVADLALDYARKAVKFMGAKESAANQMRTLELLVQTLKKAKKGEEIKQYQGRIEGLESKVHEEYVQKSRPFKTSKFKGRKGKSKRVVLVELFTGAQCPPCVASDLAFDALGETYKTSEVVLLQYHLHIPRPDALTNPACEARRKYYIDDIEATPSIFFNGKFDAPGGGSAREGEDKYREYRGFIDPLLEKPATVKLTVKVVRKGDKIDITAETADLTKPGKQIRLRLALVEGWVKYAGFNQLPYHHHVVRAMPGGPEGLALTRKTGKQTATVDLAKLRQDLKSYLDNYAKKKKAFPDDQRPLALRDLYVVAFVQNDESREVLQAVQVKVDGESEKKKDKKDKKDEKDKKEKKEKV